MKIWIDLSNSPHVNFFSGMIGELKKQHSVLLTCRPLANTIELLDQTGFRYHVVGNHYGRSATRKLIGFGIQTARLCRFLKGRRLDVAISHSSFYAPLVARLLGIPSIYMNDNEHAQGNRLAFLFADKIIVPELLGGANLAKHWAKPTKVVAYPGVKEGIYLWNYTSIEPEEDQYSSKPDGLKTIFIRPEPLSAQYYKAELNFIDDLVLDLKDRFNLVILPRGKVQETYYRHPRFAGIHLPEKPIGLSRIMKNCDLFIGAGGTMTREAAVLGVPTISIYQDKLLEVDKYLIEKGAMVHLKTPNAGAVTDFFAKRKKKRADCELLGKGKEAYDLVMKSILSMADTR
ncbi:MAG: DUF354 domain-containing protein [Syntrophobacteraceae bacterium]